MSFLTQFFIKKAAENANNIANLSNIVPTVDIAPPETSIGKITGGPTGGPIVDLSTLGRNEYTPRSSVSNLVTTPRSWEDENNDEKYRPSPYSYQRVTPPPVYFSPFDFQSDNYVPNERIGEQKENILQALDKRLRDYTSTMGGTNTQRHEQDRIAMKDAIGRLISKDVSPEVPKAKQAMPVVKGQKPPLDENGMPMTIRKNLDGTMEYVKSQGSTIGGPKRVVNLSSPEPMTRKLEAPTITMDDSDGNSEKGNLSKRLILESLARLQGRG